MAKRRHTLGSFGSTRQRHLESAESLLDHANYGITVAEGEIAKGRCENALAYVIEGIWAVGAYQAHLVAQNQPKKREADGLLEARKLMRRAKAAVAACGRK